MNPSQNQQLFPISESEDDYFTGIAKNGEQVLMGLICPELVAYFFSKYGDLLKRETRTWKYPATVKNYVYDVENKNFKKNLDSQFNEWKNEIGFQPSIIKVKAFFDDQYSVGVEEIPKFLELGQNYSGSFSEWLNSFGETLSDEVDEKFSSEETIEEYKQREKDIKEWVESGSFVFWWFKEYPIIVEKDYKASNEAVFYETKTRHQKINSIKTF